VVFIGVVCSELRTPVVASGRERKREKCLMIMNKESNYFAIGKLFASLTTRFCARRSLSGQRAGDLRIDWTPDFPGLFQKPNARRK